MNNIKFGVLVFGLLGVVSWFIPMEVAPGGPSFAMFAMREVDPGSVYMVLGGFAAAAVMGGLALKGGMQRWQSIVALIGFGMFFLKFRAQLGDMFSMPLAGKLMIISAIGGLICALATFGAKPDPAR